MEIFLSRPVVIGLAIAGAAFSVAASVLRVRGKLSAARASQLNLAGYVLMGTSMALFLWVGLRAPT